MTLTAASASSAIFSSNAVIPSAGISPCTSVMIRSTTGPHGCAAADPSPVGLGATGAARRPRLVSMPTAREVPPDPAVNTLITDHLPLVGQVLGSVSARYPRHADREELRQAATLGLVEAAHRFDASRGVPFERWAALRIRGAIVDAVRSVDFAPRALRAAGRELEQATSTLTLALGRTPTREELAAQLDCPLADLDRTEARLHRSLVLSLDAASDPDDDHSSLAHRLVSSEPEPASALVEQDERLALRDAVAMLPESLREVVAGYFLRGETSADIADRLGVTESRVSQLRSEALRLLRSGLEQVAATTDGPGAQAQRATRPVGRIERKAARQSEFAARLLERTPLTARPLVPSPRRPSARVRQYATA